MQNFIVNSYFRSQLFFLIDTAALESIGYDITVLLLTCKIILKKEISIQLIAVLVTIEEIGLNTFSCLLTVHFIISSLTLFVSQTSTRYMETP